MFDNTFFWSKWGIANAKAKTTLTCDETVVVYLEPAMFRQILESECPTTLASCLAVRRRFRYHSNNAIACLPYKRRPSGASLALIVDGFL